jgi:hypothetical protein
MSPMQSRYARVIVICQLDRYANGLKPVEVERFLSRRGYRVQIVNTQPSQRSVPRSSQGRFRSTRSTWLSARPLRRGRARRQLGGANAVRLPHALGGRGVP